MTEAEAFGQFEVESNLIRKKDKCRTCIENCSWKDYHYNRPSWGPLDLFVILVFFMMLFLSTPAIASFSDYFSGDSAKATVVGYVTKPEYCIWATYLILNYTVNGTIYTNQNRLEFVSCGEYDWKALQRAKWIYPLGTKVSIWYLNSNPNILPKSNPQYWMVIASIPFSISIICLLYLSFHFLAVWCCGCAPWCMKENKVIRCYDPFYDGRLDKVDY